MEISALSNDAPYKISDVAGRGKGVLTTRALKVGDEVLQETALLTVKTFMVLSGVVVWRRTKVEQVYERLGASEKKSYESLHPIRTARASATLEGVAGLSTLETALRCRAGKEGEEKSESVNSTTAPSLTLRQHREVWDKNGFHFCDDDDVRVNRILHLAVLPAVLTVVIGCAYAHWFHATYLKSVLGAGILFFTMLGPVSMRVFYFGSQALFVQASRVNHSCIPNSVWRVSGQRAPLGGAPNSIGTPNAMSTAGSDDDVTGPRTLSLCVRQKVDKGEELSIDYIPELGHLDSAERRKLLLQEYDFLCSCPRCLASTESDEAEEVE